MFEQFNQLSKMSQFKLRHLFKANYLALALWFSGEWESLGFQDQSEAIIWLANKIGSRCKSHNSKQTWEMLKISPLVTGLFEGYVKALIEESKPYKPDAKTTEIILWLATDIKGLSLTTLSNKGHLPKSNTYRLLQRLVKRGLVKKDSKGLYSLVLNRYLLTYLRYISYIYSLHIIYNTTFRITPPVDQPDKPKRLITYRPDQPDKPFLVFEPYKDFHPVVLMLMRNGKIKIDPQGIEHFEHSLNMVTRLEMNMIASPKDTPQQFYTDLQLEINKHTWHERYYNIPQFLNDYCATDFPVDTVAEYYRMRCPFHNGDGFNFYIWFDGHFFCHRCHEKGRGFPEFVRKILPDMEYVEALYLALDYCFEQTPYDKPNEYGNYAPPQVAGSFVDRKQIHDLELQSAKDFWTGQNLLSVFKQDWTNLTLAKSYLYGRGFTPETLQHFHVYDLSDFDKRYPVYIPLAQNGEVYGSMRRAVYEDVKPKYMTAPGTPKSNYLYGEVSVGAIPLIVEGVTDVWMAYQYGYKDVAALLGSYLSDSQASFLASQGVKRALIATDMDKAGDEAFVICQEKLKRLGIEAVRFIYHAKDVALLNGEQFQQDLKLVLET